MENVIVEKKKNPKLFSMFWNPGEQLNRIRQNPKIWIPLAYCYDTVHSRFNDYGLYDEN